MRSLLGCLIAVLGCLVAVASPAAEAASRSDAKPSRSGVLIPNIVLITVDTLRADHLHIYGRRSHTSRNIDLLGERGVVFTKARSQAPWTLPSMASLHTSRYPSQHGAIKLDASIRADAPMVAETLHSAGFRTVGVVSHLFVSNRYGFARGFDTFHESNVQGHEAVTSPEITEKALQLWRGSAKGPTFLWAHYFDPHFSYRRHPAFSMAHRFDSRFEAPIHDFQLTPEVLAGEARLTASQIDYIQAVYDEEIAFTDYWIGRLIAGVRASARMYPTIFIVTADHGEYFNERGRFAHGKDLYDELIHVPLLVGGNLPSDLRGVRVEAPVEVASIAATIMGIARIEEHPFQGSDLLAVAMGKQDPGPVFSEGGYAFGDRDRRNSVVHRGHKLIHNLDDDTYELYDLGEDPHERTNLWTRDGKSAVKAHLESQLERFEGATAIMKAGTVELSEQDLEGLRVLGYVEDSK